MTARLVWEQPCDHGIVDGFCQVLLCNHDHPTDGSPKEECFCPGGERRVLDTTLTLYGTNGRPEEPNYPDPKTVEEAVSLWDSILGQHPGSDLAYYLVLDAARDWLRIKSIPDDMRRRAFYAYLATVGEIAGEGDVDVSIEALNAALIAALTPSGEGQTSESFAPS